MIKKVVLVMFGCFLICVLAICAVTFRTAKSEIKTSNIEMIRLGMSSNKLISLLGKPIRVDGSDSSKVFVYTKPIPYVKNYPMLWVHLDKNLLVKEVYAKRYVLFGVDDECIYLLSPGAKSIQREKFESCFE